MKISLLTRIAAAAFLFVAFATSHAASRGEPKGKWFARDNHDIRFAVKEGEVTYCPTRKSRAPVPET